MSGGGRGFAHRRCDCGDHRRFDRRGRAVERELFVGQAHVRVAQLGGVHGIGFIEGAIESIQAAKQIIIKSWVSQRNTFDQERWAYLFNEGLIDNATANAWADEVWSEEVFDDVDAEESVHE